jgi:hypothetical protein
MAELNEVPAPKPPDSNAGPDFDAIRNATARERRASLSDRCRVVSAGIVAVSWGLIVGESKAVGPLTALPRELLIVAASLGVLVFFLDYGQSLSEYLDATLLWGKFLGPGGRLMFGAKQIVTCGSAATLLAAALLLIINAVPAVAESDQWSIWVGYISYNENPSPGRKSVLQMSEANPFTQVISAKEDGASCQGKVKGNRLTLICSSGVRLDGVINQGRQYQGTWVPTSAADVEGGKFDYKFSKYYRPQ